MNTYKKSKFSHIFRKYGKKPAMHYLSELGKNKEDINKICNDFEKIY